MLQNLYKLRGDATAQATLRRSVAGAARLAQTQAQIADGATVNATREAAKTAAAAARAAAVEKRRHKRELLERYTDVAKSNRQGDTTTRYVWQLEQPIFLFERQGRNYRAINELKARLRHLASATHGGSIRLILAPDLSDTGDEGNAMSTPFHTSPTSALKILIDKLDEKEVQYEANGDADPSLLVYNLVVEVKRCNEENAAASQMRRTKANEKWLVPGEFNTQKNCFYVSFCMLHRAQAFLTLYAEWLEGGTSKYPDFNQAAVVKKQDMRKSMKLADETMLEAFTDTEMARRVIEHSNPKTPLRVYDGQFKLIEEIHPGTSTSTHKRLKTAPRQALEMQRSQNHWRPLIPWDQMDPALADRIKTAISAKSRAVQPDTTAQPIVKYFKGDKVRDRRMVSWDVEATPNNECDPTTHAFKVYAAGMAWYRSPFTPRSKIAEPADCTVFHDGDKAMLYKSFWGLDSLRQMVLFIAANQQYFAKSTFYAHNGGKFDLPLLLREHLFEFEGALINGDKCTILNGRWIGFEVLFLKNESCICFRDSIALLAGSLDKLAKEYKVPHPKLKESVDHDDVTLQNWHMFPQMHQYLAHDCLGLLELLDRFSAEIFEVSHTKVFEKNQCERNVANILEALLGMERMALKKQRPEWLITKPANGKKGKRLELDGFSEIDRIAFEYQGEQHYVKNHPFHKNPGDFEALVANDAAKLQLCAENDVRLVVVPYMANKNPNQLVKYIQQALSELGVPIDATVKLDSVMVTQPRILNTGSLNITSVMTAAGLAKRIFYNTFYDGGRFPLYTLTKEQDHYIRKPSYYGGRVELFHFGVVNGPVFYLDFTSLYPAMGYAHPMPYGAPEFWPSFEPPSADEAMGFGMHVALTRREVMNRADLTGYCRWALSLTNPPKSVRMFAHLLRSPQGPEWARDTNPSALPTPFFGFVRGLVRSTALGKHRMALHGVKSADSDNLPRGARGKLLFPHLDDWRELTLFSEELRLGESMGLYEYEPIDGIAFSSAPILRKAFETFFDMKAQAKMEGKSAKEKAIKIIANSTYGFFGQRTDDRESVKIFLSGDVPVYDYLARNALIEEADHGRYTCLRVVEDMHLKDFNVGVAAAITSYARMRLWRLMDAIDQRGGRLFSCDTDSITTNLDMSKHPDLLAEFIPDWQSDSPGAELGSLKCECADEVEKHVKKSVVLPPSPVDLSEDLRKTVAARVRMAKERDSVTWKPMPFHHPGGSLCNGANKLYILRTQLTSGKEIEIAKAKGMSKYDKDGNALFKWEDYEAMHHPTDPKPLVCLQAQFRLGTAGYCRDGGVRPITIHKIRKKASAKYDKGVVQPDGRIVPFAI